MPDLKRRDFLKDGAAGVAGAVPSLSEASFSSTIGRTTIGRVSHLSRTGSTKGRSPITALTPMRQAARW